MLNFTAAVTLAACAPASEAQIRDALTSWASAFDAGDLEGTMAIFSPGVVMHFQGQPDVGFEQLQRIYGRGFARQAESGRTARWVPTYDQIFVSGELANAFGTWRLEVTEAAGTRVTQTNYSVDVMRRDPDCRWRVVRSLTYPLVPNGR